MPSGENLKHRFKWARFGMGGMLGKPMRAFLAGGIWRGVVLDLWPAPDMQRARLPT
jgi:hypothetical protein